MNLLQQDSNSSWHLSVTSGSTSEVHLPPEANRGFQFRSRVPLAMVFRGQISATAVVVSETVYDE